MKIDKAIIECELAYTKCFSKFLQNENVVRFRDDELLGMYYHNYSYIEKKMSAAELSSIIEAEIAVRHSEECDFCNLQLNFEPESELFSMLTYQSDKSRNGYYAFDISKVSELQTVSGCTVKKVNNQEMVDDVLFCDLQHDEARLGKDFCTRRCYRRAQIYVSDDGVDSYACYYNGEIVGNCNLFLHEGVAKIEDFGVNPTAQRKGFGTTILRALIEIALKDNAHTIYLVTDEDDTAKEMYQKIGFSKIGERTDLFFDLKSI